MEERKRWVEPKLIKTTPYENGLHTISWTVTDSDGNSDGIGTADIFPSGTPGEQGAGTGVCEWRSKEKIFIYKNFPEIPNMIWENKKIKSWIFFPFMLYNNLM
jgi:hypothetical protein